MARIYFIFILVYSLCLISCEGFKSSYVDVDVKHDYNFNKLLVIAALLEERHAQTGFYPRELMEVKADYRDYLSKNPELRNKYLSTPWLNNSVTIEFAINSTGNAIHYVSLKPETNYYLYTRYGIQDVILSFNDLENIRNGTYKERQSGLYIIYNGGSVRCPGKPFSNLSLANVHMFLREIKYGRIRPMVFN